MLYTISYTIHNYVLMFLAIVLQIRLLNAAITSAKAGHPLYRKPLANDPSEKLIEVHVAAFKWNMQSRTFQNDGR